MLKKVFAWSLIMLMVTFITGCNTIEGVGKDIKKGGEAIQKSAK